MQNTAAHLVFNLPKFSHVTHLLHELHWLPVAALIQFKTMVLAFKAINGAAPSTAKNWSDHTPNWSILLYYISWPACTTSTERKQSSLSKVVTLFSSGTLVV